MKKLTCVEGCFHYGAMPVTRPFMRVIIRQVTKHREEMQLARQCRAFEIIAEKQGW